MHAEIDKKLYIKQLEGVIIVLNKVYKLNKALYSLKQLLR